MMLLFWLPLVKAAWASSVLTAAGLIPLLRTVAVASTTTGLVLALLLAGNGLVLFGILAFLPRLYPYVRKLAWNVRVGEEECGELQQKLDRQYTFIGRSPGLDARKLYQIVVHGPLYVLASWKTLLLFPGMVWKHQVRRFIHGKTKLDVPDKNVAMMCVQTSTVLLCHFDATARTLRMKLPDNAPSLGRTGRNLDTRSLQILFNAEDWSILEASTSLGPVVDEGSISRNELLVSAVNYILAHWFHSLIHVAAEKCALEIQSKRIAELEPSCHFVSSLHEGLLHGPLSPVNLAAPFSGSNHDSRDLLAAVNESPHANHCIDSNKEFLEYYDFAMRARRAVHQLVRQYQLPVDAENLFLCAVWHSVDHNGYTIATKDLPLWSIDGLDSWLSRWRAFTFVKIWATNEYLNPFDSDLLRDHVAEGAFYSSLYADLMQINPGLANVVRITCGF